jgi:hypothetical protein
MMRPPVGLLGLSILATPAPPLVVSRFSAIPTPTGRAGGASCSRGYYSPRQDIGRLTAEGSCGRLFEGRADRGIEDAGNLTSFVRRRINARSIISKRRLASPDAAEPGPAYSQQPDGYGGGRGDVCSSGAPRKSTDKTPNPVD